jgi:hypothetical protein
LVGLGYPEQFNIVRWQLEEAFDPATLETIPIPADLRCPLLTTSQLRRLSDADRADYAERKEARKVWARDHWMRVPAWGGRQTPGGEYRYSAQACREWYQRSLGQREE